MELSMQTLIDNSEPIPESGCWVWMRAEDGRGYGCLAYKKDGKKWALMKTHRLAYELTFGKIPTGLVIHHKCYVTACWNPDHLSAITQRENMFDKNSALPTRKYVESVACWRCGGEWVTRTRKSHGKLTTHRRCLACHARKEKARYRAKHGLLSD